MRETMASQRPHGGRRGSYRARPLGEGIGRRFGYDRVSAAREEFITSCVPDSLVQKRPLGKIVWPHNVDSDGWRGFRSTPADLTRLLPGIAPEEIANAI